MEVLKVRRKAGVIDVRDSDTKHTNAFVWAHTVLHGMCVSFLSSIDVTQCLAT